MKEINITATVKVYKNADELSPADLTLMRRARAAAEDSYSPYSKFKVGAAILLENGQILGGSNQENASYPLCLCAERTALGAAASLHPRSAVTVLAVTAKSDKHKIDQPISPCGACRQVIRETEMKFDTPIRILLQGETGEVYEFATAKDLLPLSFSGKFL